MSDLAATARNHPYESRFMRFSFAILLFAGLTGCTTCRADPGVASRLIGHWLAASGNWRSKSRRVTPRPAMHGYAERFHVFSPTGA
jgi:hypothetical protein